MFSKKETVPNKLSKRLIEGGTTIKHEHGRGNRDKLNSRNTPPTSSLGTIRLPLHDGVIRGNTMTGRAPVIAKRETVLNKLYKIRQRRSKMALPRRKTNFVRENPEERRSIPQRLNIDARSERILRKYLTTWYCTWPDYQG